MNGETTRGSAQSAVVGRVWFAVTALAVSFGIVVQLIVAADTASSVFRSPTARALNMFAYFTIESNIIVGVTSLLLALKLQRTSPVFKMFRLSGVAAIIITGVVYHVLLAGLTELHGWGIVATQTLHTAVPILAVLGWLLFGPRGLTSWRIVGLAFVYPLAWVAFTLVRGASIDWYPYPFINVDERGYARVSVNIAVITAIYFVLAAGAVWLDRWLERRNQRADTSGREG